MEKENEILTDDQLKDVSGGSQRLSMTSDSCKGRTQRECNAPIFRPVCIWEGGECVGR
jgi:hypothetical protein